MLPRTPTCRRVLWWGSMLLLAAAINWLVAWACVLWSYPKPWNSSIEVTNLAALHADERRAHQLGWLPDNWTIQTDWTWYIQSVLVRKSTGWGISVTELEMLEAHGQSSSGRRLPVGSVCVVRSGWPLPALHASHRRVLPRVLDDRPREGPFTVDQMPDSESCWHNAIQAPAWMAGHPIVRTTAGPPWFPLPYGVLPLGFALNTIFWLAVIVSPSITFRVIRRAIRLRRGLCPTCAYDVRGLTTCPECGAAVSAVAQ